MQDRYGRQRSYYLDENHHAEANAALGGIHLLYERWNQQVPEYLSALLAVILQKSANGSKRDLATPKY
jgi:hypothetical protein